MRDQLTNGAGDGLAHVRQLLQAVGPAIPKYFVHRHLHRTDGPRRTQLRYHTVSIGTLVLQQPGRFLETSSHILIHTVHHRTRSCASANTAPRTLALFANVPRTKIPAYGNFFVALLALDPAVRKRMLWPVTCLDRRRSYL